MQRPDLKTFLEKIEAAPLVARPSGEGWIQFAVRSEQTGVACEITEATYRYYLVRIHTALGDGRFASVEGPQAIRLFWIVQGTYRCRQLTLEETAEFCLLAGILPPS